VIAASVRSAICYLFTFPWVGLLAEWEVSVDFKISSSEGGGGLVDKMLHKERFYNTCSDFCHISKTAYTFILNFSCYHITKQIITVFLLEQHEKTKFTFSC
jgi:hypothetical protein